MKDVFDSKKIKDAKTKFLNLLKKKKLYHVTRSKNVDNIERNGLKAPAYLSFGSPSWDGDVVFSVDPHDVSDVYPDPEHLIDGGYFDDIEGTISFETVTKEIDKDMLYWMYFDYSKNEGFPSDRIINGFWLVSTKPISKEKLTREN